MPPPTAGCPKGGEHVWKPSGQAGGWKDTGGEPYVMMYFCCKKCGTTHTGRWYKDLKVKK